MSGCGETPPPAAPPQPAAAPAAPVQLQSIDATKLPAVGHVTPPLDEGRVQLSLPEEWAWAPRSKEYLIKAQMSRDSRYPNVTAYAVPAGQIEDAQPDNAQPDNTQPDNVLEFAKNFQKTLDAELASQGIKLAENVHPVQIGDFVGVEYVRRAKIGADSVDRLFLVTVKKGRKYSLEMRALQGTLPRYRPFARAIAAGMNFNPGAEGAPPAP